MNRNVSGGAGTTAHATYDVVPSKGGWRVEMAGDSVSEWHASKDDAVRRARDLVRGYGSWRVRVLTASGSVEQELTSAEATS